MTTWYQKASVARPGDMCQTLLTSNGGRIAAAALCFGMLIYPLACGGPTPGQGAVGQMRSSTSSEVTELSEGGTWTLLPRAAVVITTTAPSRIHALFVAEVVGKVERNPVVVDGEVIGLFPIGYPVEVRLKIDDEEMLPASTQLTGHGTAFASYSFLALHDDVAPGGHFVIVEWRSAEPGATIRNRTLTVWEERK